MSAATLPPRVCVRCTKPILAIEGCTRAGEGWAHLKCRGPVSGGAVGDIEERCAEYEWDGAPRGVCVVCGMFYEENVSHAGKDAPDLRPKHRFKAAPSGGGGGMKKLRRSDISEVENAGELFEDLCQRMVDYLSDRSEKWRDSDAGIAYQAWLDSYERVRDAIGELQAEPQP